MLNRIIRNSGAQAVSLGASLLDRLLVVGVLLHAWGPDRYADWAHIVALAGLLSFAELGLNIYYGNRFQQAFATGDKAAFRHMASIALALSGMIATATFALFAVCMLSADAIFVGLPKQDLEAAVTASLLLGWVAASRIARGSISQIFRGRGEFALGVTLDALCALAASVMTLSIAALGHGPTEAAVGLLAVDLVFGWGLMLAAIAARYPDLSFSPKLPEWHDLRSVAREVRWLAPIQGAPTAWLHLPTLMIAASGTPGSLMVSFLVLRTTANLLKTGATFASIAIGTEVVADHSRGEHALTIRRIGQAGRFLCMTMSALAAGLCVFGPDILAVWTGDRTHFNAAVAAIMFASAALSALTSPLSSTLMFGRDLKPAALAQISQFAIGIPIALALTEPMGILGTALGLAAGELAAALIVLPHLARSHFRGSALPLLKPMFAAFAVTAWSGTCAYIAHQVAAPYGLAGTAIAGGAWFIAALPPVIWFACPREMRARFRARLTSRTT